MDQFTFRLAPSLRTDLEYEAAAKGEGLGDLIRDVLTEYTARRLPRVEADRR